MPQYTVSIQDYQYMSSLPGYRFVGGGKESNTVIFETKPEYYEQDRLKNIIPAPTPQPGFGGVPKDAPQPQQPSSGGMATITGPVTVYWKDTGKVYQTLEAGQSMNYNTTLLTLGGGAITNQTNTGTMTPTGIPATSQVPSGQQYLTAHPGLTELQVKDLYRSRGINLGEWRGTAEQWKAMSTFEEVEAGIKKAQQSIAQIQAGIAGTSAQTGLIGSAREGDVRINPQTGGQEMYDPTGTWVPLTSGMQPKGQEKPADWQSQIPASAIQPSGMINTKAGAMNLPDIMSYVGGEAEVGGFGSPISLDTDGVQMTSTDIGDIIKEISETANWSPETTIVGQEADAARLAIEKSAADALKTLQQNLAKKGMTFSGIRTVAETDLAAEALAKKAQIDLGVAKSIIVAARNEQSRRENAIAAQQKAASDALKASGYIMNPYTGEMEKTLERERYELDAWKAQQVEPDIRTVGGSLIEYDPSTGAVTTLYEGQPDYKYWENANGYVTQYNPKTGEMAGLGVIGKGFKGETSLYEPSDFSGKYSEAYLSTRASDYLNNDGTIDWMAVDNLENTDKALWNDMTLFLQTAVTNSREISPVPTSQNTSKGWLSTLTESIVQAPSNIKWLLGLED